MDDHTVISFYDGSKIKKETVDIFAQGQDVEVVEKGGNDAASRAESYYRHDNYGKYHALENNCEHFATSCVSGRHGGESIQSRRVAATTVAGLAVGAVVGGPMGAAVGGTLGGLYAVYGQINS